MKLIECQSIPFPTPGCFVKATESSLSDYLTIAEGEEMDSCLSAKLKGLTASFRI